MFYLKNKYIFNIRRMRAFFQLKFIFHRHSTLVYNIVNLKYKLKIAPTLVDLRIILYDTEK